MIGGILEQVWSEGVTAKEMAIGVAKVFAYTILGFVIFWELCGIAGAQQGEDSS